MLYGNFTFKCLILKSALALAENIVISFHFQLTLLGHDLTDNFVSPAQEKPVERLITR